MKNEGWKVVKKDERYVVSDNTVLNKLVTSITELNPTFSTTGHSHVEQEEVYIVIDGKGIIHINGEDIPLSKGDFINVFPQSKRALKASEDTDLVYICAGAVKNEKYPDDKTKNTLINDGIPDFDNLPPWYVGNTKIAELNKRLKNDRKGKKK